MPKIIDALVAIDPVAVMRDHGNPDGYVPLKNDGLGYVFAVTSFADIAQSTDASEVCAQQAHDHQEEEGGDDVKLVITVGDVARFRSTPLGWRSDYQCFIDQIVADSSPHCMTQPNDVCRSVSSTDMNPAVPPFTQYLRISEADYYHEATMLRTGTVNLTLNFSIYDHTAHRLGGYSFQSKIKINP
ncbi:AidA/PixA family protein [Trinickia sp.]|uniref:AidA/PixA family protein n=1 Tax=Trinickia sp. TaxID=2571163 RepID=UPI003F7F1F2B